MTTTRPHGRRVQLSKSRRHEGLLATVPGGDPMLENWLRANGKALYTADGKLGFDRRRSHRLVQAVGRSAQGQCLRRPGRSGARCHRGDRHHDDHARQGRHHLRQLEPAHRLPGREQGRADDDQLPAPQGAASAAVTIASPASSGSVKPKGANIEDSVKYVSFFINDLEAGKVLGVERGIPCSAGVRAAVAPGLKPQDQLALNFVSNLGDLLGPLPPSPPAAAGEVDDPAQHQEPVGGLRPGRRRKRPAPPSSRKRSDILDRAAKKA